MFDYIKTALIVLVVTVFAACDSDDEIVGSDIVSTGAMFVTLQLVDNGGEFVFVEAQLTVGVPPSDENENDIYIDLVSGDELWASAGDNLEDLDLGDDLFGGLEGLVDTQVQLTRGTARGNVDIEFIFFRAIINSTHAWYSARLPANANESDSEYRLSLFREEGIDAKQSTITIPAAYELTGPASNESLSRSGEDIAISWSPVEENTSVEIEANTTCPSFEFESYTETLDSDTGTFTIPSGALASDTLEGNCSTTIHVRKFRVGKFDPAFTGGIATGYQVRKVVVSTTE